MDATAQRLADTARAFDSVAADYDGPIGNNALIQRMRAYLWRAVLSLFPRGARLLDLGCGTGIDAVYFATRGFDLVATDWSPQMVARSRIRVLEAGLSAKIRVERIGIQELDRLEGVQFDGIYSDLGPLNCVPDLRAVARDCAALLKPNGRLVASVMGRTCPWEFIYYLARGKPARARLRGLPGIVPVNLNRRTVWTRYYGPREFYRSFAEEFDLTHYRALGLFMPPPYLIRLYETGGSLFAPLAWLDDHLGSLPLVREVGDHFLTVLTKRG